MKMAQKVVKCVGAFPDFRESFRNFFADRQKKRQMLREILREIRPALGALFCEIARITSADVTRNSLKLRLIFLSCSKIGGGWYRRGNAVPVRVRSGG